MACQVSYLVHGTGGVTMHPLRALWGWYNIVYWTSLNKYQDVNTPISWVQSAILDGFKMAATKKTKCLYSVLSASYHLFCLLL